MVEYASDEDQAEALRKWWLENYRSLIGGVIIGLAAIIGWRVWTHYQAQRETSASATFSALVQAVRANDHGHVQKLGHALVENYTDTPYAVQASLMLAQARLQAGDAAAAVNHLKWAMHHTDDHGIELLARLRLARLQLAGGKPQAALKQLNGAKAGGFTPLYAELRGDAQRALGHMKAARKAYRKALNKLKPGIGNRSLLQMKLEALGGTAPSSAQPDKR